MKYRLVNLSEIREYPICVTPPDAGSLEFDALKASINARGVLCPIYLADRESHFVVIDGLRRVLACRELCLLKIPALVTEVTDEQILTYLLCKSAPRSRTTKRQYKLHMQRIMAQRPVITMTGMVALIGWPRAKIQEMLDLNDLYSDLWSDVEDGRICLANGFLLARLPQDEQLKHAALARDLPAAEFAPIVMHKVKELKGKKK